MLHSLYRRTKRLRTVLFYVIVVGGAPVDWLRYVSALLKELVRYVTG